MKQIKAVEEIKKIKMACQLISQVHHKTRALDVVGWTEFQIKEYILKSIQDLNMNELAFPVIVGSGERSLVLHAEPTNKIVAEGDLVLIDIGLKYEGYCSDMTRTWSANRKMTTQQNEIYEIVHRAQLAVLNSISKNHSLASLHEIAQKSLCQGLDNTELCGQYDIEKIYPHKTSHWIGKDVHDDCPYIDEHGQPILLKSGMCFTVEPGLYIQNTNTRYDGIGIRIEDVVVVTENGIEILTI